MNSKNIIQENLPQLIVGLDSLGDDANYVHVLDTKDDGIYYCPCCRGIIKPRAYKSDNNYKVQAHFYHETGGCNEESYVHYICKNWLFEEGCKFIVNDVEYTVSSVEVEKTLHTSFGDYRPDIIVYTTCGKTFYFEIKNTNKKNELYIPKWDDLGNDVVEVDIRYFINKKFENDILVFKLIYSDGECFIKSYTRRDYDELIAKRKLKWKRQDKINYKIQWERLDCFWSALSDFILGNSDEASVLEYFKNLDYKDKVWCYLNVKNKTCVKNFKETLREIINQCFLDKVQKIKEKYQKNVENKIDIIVYHVSPMIYEFTSIGYFKFLDYTLYHSLKLRVKLGSGKIFYTSDLDDIEIQMGVLLSNIDFFNNFLEKVNTLSSLPYITNVHPISHWYTDKYGIDNVRFNIDFSANVHNRYIKELIGNTSFTCHNFDIEVMKNSYKYFYDMANKNLKRELFLIALKNNSLFQNTYMYLENKCKSELGHMNTSMHYDENAVFLKHGYEVLYMWKFNNTFTGFENEMKEYFDDKIQFILDKYNEIIECSSTINSCKNNIWKSCVADGDIRISLLNPEDGSVIESIYINLYKVSGLIDCICNKMRDLLDYAENYKGIRFLEVV